MPGPGEDFEFVPTGRAESSPVDDELIGAGDRTRQPSWRRRVVPLALVVALAALVAARVVTRSPSHAGADRVAPSTSQRAPSVIATPAPVLQFDEVALCASGAAADKIDTVDVRLTARRPVTILAVEPVRTVTRVALVGARLRPACGSGRIESLTGTRVLPRGPRFLELLLRVTTDCGLPAIAVRVRYRSDRGSGVAVIDDVAPLEICP